MCTVPFFAVRRTVKKGSKRNVEPAKNNSNMLTFIKKYDFMRFFLHVSFVYGKIYIHYVQKSVFIAHKQ